MRVILIAVMLLAFTAPAIGQQKPPPPLTGNIIRDIGNLKSGSGGSSSAQNPIEQLIQTLVDTDEAVRLSTAIPGVPDPVGGSCWKSFAGISAVIKEKPDLLTGKAAADLEALRLLHISLNQVCANPNCGQMWNDLQNVVTAINPISLPVSLTSICAKIPVIGTSVAPQAPPVVTAPTTPAVVVPPTPPANPQ